ncbi:FtsW/RodA/SpoVE family cell cycle protein [Limosilactobacillus vaginalis]|nr:cell cycle protein, FtsW/RodA/SpoVE family [Limosilactobacillus vaginalis DSM 5837 = ATCC 49540]MCZ3745808.1 FtsW/RodA/SpoVE family cell cycle protein [Limosilactobacillus vaginalis]KRM48709.1 FtsW RodA SpoVE family cell division protein [Limosilactobacillus vaginalis DSM 5837 = ATCC 49540]MCZ3750789.1 FtsW/RodA/SpoVE family cell cycle protein [Limosilactobacillus vaginalis]MCZ3755963.1 FtsW/RodA/SpoVE family cell cycle protein [Limosilactobacillus vaginalis]
MIGIVMVYSASSAIEMQNGGTPTSYLIKQTIYVIMGICCLLFGANYPLKHYRTPRFLRDSTLAMIGMLLFVLVLSHAVNGAKGWINLGVINIQPVEICKIYFILYLSDRMARVRARNDHFISSGGGPWLVVALCLLLIVLQPDIGGMAINVMIVAVLFLACDFRWSFGISILLIIPIMCYLLVEKAVESGLIHGYRMARFVAFLNPFGNASGSGSQLVNSYYAISNGGVFGSGLGNSVQKMGYLPEPNTDFIMSITSEELGLVGVSVILILLMIIICRMIQIGVRSNSMYEMLLCYGSATFILIEAFFNIGGVLGLLPITGVTFPFISYGGSSMLILSFTVGIIMNISIQQNKQRALRRGARQPRRARG